MKKIFLLTILLIIKHAGYSQNYMKYYTYMNNAQIFLADSNYSKAYMIYKKCLKKYVPFTYDCVEAYKCAVNIKKYSNAKYFIYNAVKNGYDPKYIYDTTNIFDGLQPQCKEIKYNKNKLQRLHKKYFQSIDIDYSIDLINLLAVDQGLRMSKFENSEDTSIQKAYWSDSIFRKKYLDLYYKSMNIIDSNNYKTLCTYMKEKGLNMRKILNGGYIGGVIILAHDLYLCNSFNNCDSIVNYLKEQIIKGNFDPSMFARIYDKYYLGKYNYSYYGVFRGNDISLYDPKNVDKRRSEIGLTTINEEEKIIKDKFVFKNYNNGSDNK